MACICHDECLVSVAPQPTPAHTSAGQRQHGANPVPIVRKVAVLLAFAVWTSRLGAQVAGAHRVHLGVVGHPFEQEPYRDISPVEQLNLLAELGAGWYRCDWSEARFRNAPRAYDDLVSHARRRNIRLLPILFPAISWQDDAEEVLRKRSFEYARLVVSRYKRTITHWELSNELDGFCMIRKGETTRTGEAWQWGDPDGDRPEHYHEGRYRKALAVLRGLCEGVRAADPKARRIINTGGWLHYGFVERLVREDKVPFEILSWHWYSEMGDIAAVRGNFNLLARLASFGKPIWITEMNRRGGSLGDEGERLQAEYLTGTIQQMSRQNAIRAVFVYELLDEPQFGPDNPESHYGLVRVEKREGRWRVGSLKQAFHRLRVLARGRSATSEHRMR